jgi:hypothetical protein
MDLTTEGPLVHTAGTRRTLSPARIVSLVLIAIVVAGLAYLHVGRGSAPVSVPAGAHAGELSLHPCTYPTEHGSYDADCGTLVVPENRSVAGPV